MPGFTETKTHPDFQQVTAIGIAPSELGYRMRTAPRQVGLALKKAATPIVKRAEFRFRVRPTPGAASPDKPGNAFLAFGDGATDDRLVKCGFRISGKRLFIVQGPLLKGSSKSAPVDVKADEVAEIQVVVDLEGQKVAVTMHDETLEAPLATRLEAVTWFGYSITSVTSDFSSIDVVAP